MNRICQPDIGRSGLDEVTERTIRFAFGSLGREFKFEDAVHQGVLVAGITEIRPAWLVEGGIGRYGIGGNRCANKIVVAIDDAIRVIDEILKTLWVFQRIGRYKRRVVKVTGRACRIFIFIAVVEPKMVAGPNQTEEVDSERLGCSSLLGNILGNFALSKGHGGLSVAGNTPGWV